MEAGLDEAKLEAWQANARRSWEALRNDGAGQLPGGQRVHATSLVDRRLADFFARLPPDFERWTPEATRALAEVFANTLHDAREATLMKCIRRGYAAATGDTSVVPTNERKSNAPRPHAPEVEDGVVRVPYALAYAGTDGRRRAMRRAEGIALLLEESAVDFPVVCRLPFRHRAGEVVVRAGRGRYLRSVCAPARRADGAAGRGRSAGLGEMRPASLGEFADACRGDHSWIDDPFAAPLGRIALAVDELAAHPGRADEEAAALGDAVRRAGGLCVVDGHVYRETSEPALAVSLMAVRDPVTHNRRAKNVSLTWSCAGIDANAGGDHLLDWRVDYDHWNHKEATLKALSFPLSHAAVANDVGEAIAEMALLRFVGLEIPALDGDPKEGFAARFEAAARLAKPGAYYWRDGGVAWSTVLVPYVTKRALEALGDPAAASDDLERLAEEVVPGGGAEGPFRAIASVPRALLLAAAKAYRGEYDLELPPGDEDALSLMP